MEYTAQDRRIYGVAGQNKRRSAGTQGKPKVSTPAPVVNGFLNHSFTPLADKEQEDIGDCKKMEREFFSSLSNLAALYQFELPDTQGIMFPLNIMEAFAYAQVCLNRCNPKLNLFILQEQQTYLATARSLPVGGYLYYVAIYPVVQLIENQRYAQANLMLALFSYLYQIAGIPFYTDYYSYVGGNYACIENWIAEEDDCDEDRSAQVQQLQRINKDGKKIERKINKCKPLNQFKRRLDKFKPQSATDNLIKELSSKFYGLYQAYPKSRIENAVWNGLFNPGEEDRITPDLYLSFMYDYKDCISEDLFSTISEHHNNMGVIDEPVAFQRFDTPQQQERHDLDFETRIFDLIDELIDLLKIISDEERNGIN